MIMVMKDMMKIYDISKLFDRFCPPPNPLHGFIEYDHMCGKLGVWYKKGKRHRDDGPAMTNGNHNFYYLNGQIFSREKYFAALKREYSKTDIDIFEIALRYPK